MKIYHARQIVAFLSEKNRVLNLSLEYVVFSLIIIDECERNCKFEYLKFEILRVQIT